MTLDDQLRNDLFTFYGHLKALSFPLLKPDSCVSNGYYDLIDNMVEQYESILNRLLSQIPPHKTILYNSYSCKHEFEAHYTEAGTQKICKLCGINKQHARCVEG